MANDTALPAYVAWLVASIAWPTLLIAAARDSPWRRWVPLGAVLLALPFVAGAIVVVRPRLAEPPVWDFWSAWLWGRTFITGASPYLVEDIARAAAGLPGVLPDFSRGILAHHSSYPPPSMLLFAIAGAFPFAVGIYPWYAANLLGGVAAAIVLSRRFPLATGTAGLLLAIALVASMRPTLVTLALAQSNLLALLGLVIAWPRRGGPANGPGLLVAAVVKPFLIVLLLQPLIARQWRPIGTFVLIAVIISIGLDLMSPAHLLRDYLVSETKFARLHEHFWEAGAESLLSIGLRAFDEERATAQPLLFIPAMVPAILMLVVTLWAVLTLGGESTGDAMAVLVPAALLLYPATYAHFAVILAVPIAHTWVERTRLDLGDVGAGVILGLTLALMAYFRGVMTGAACLLLWTLYFIVAVRRALGSPPAVGGLRCAGA